LAVVLTTVGLVSAALLVGVNLATRDRIAANKQKELDEAITRVVPGTRASEKIYEEKGFTLYAGKDEGGTLLGYAINAAVGGFQDQIFFIIGTNAELTRLNSLYILDQKETPGLGAKITDRTAFLRFWEGKDIQQRLILRKPPIGMDELGPTEINTITGATVSSESVLAGVNGALEKTKLLKREGKLPVKE
jgi:electron transport complex protein RnfG